MLVKKKKFSKKEIKQDQLVTTYYKFMAFYEQYKRNMFIVLGAAALIIVVVVLFKYSRKSSSTVASFQLSQVMKIYEAGAYQEAIDGRPAAKIVGLKKIVDEYGSTDFGEAAKIYLGNSYYFLKKFDLALQQYENFSGSASHLKAAAYAGQASCYEAKNDAEKAAELYLKASKVSSANVLTPQYLMNAGINYLAVGKTEDAKDIFETVKRDYSKSAYSREIERYLSQVE